MKHTGILFNFIILALIVLIIMSHREGYTSDEIRQMFLDSKAGDYTTADGTINGNDFCELVKSDSKCVAGAGHMGKHMGTFFDCETVAGMEEGSLITYKCE